ncbi:MAG: hypothetical protein HQL84_03160 [Magnetococcales bacterium]|nr:hypothetical protein [Magnetococcales bacterium]MBF0149025.1 hypothetical protein [Magnetococcales bacterium]MBF0172074.1 hypothetical protein [Magnetococcales bacterium]MBF0630321.1 hypothetical protein [Magnetococcales bacterium]
MAVLVVLQKALMEHVGVRFGQEMPDVHRFAARTGCGITLPDDVPDLHSSMSGLLASLLFPGHTLRWDQGWPRGYLVALGAGLNPDPSLTWASLALTHLQPHRDQLLFVHDPDVSISVRQIEEWVEALRIPYAELGWRIHGPVGREIVLSTAMECRVEVAPFASAIHGGSLQKLLPRGAGSGLLLALLTTGQLVLAREEVNRQRMARGLMSMNSPWIHGVGRGSDFFGHGRSAGDRGRFWSDDPVTAGLALQAGWTPLEWHATKDNQVMDDREDWLHLTRSVAQAARMGPVLVCCSKDATPHPGSCGHVFLDHLVFQLAADGQGLLVLAEEVLEDPGTGGREKIFWGFSRGRQLVAKQRFWRRRTWGVGEPVSVETVRGLWLS